MKKIFTFIICVLAAISLNATSPILIENFEYQLGGLTNQGDWIKKDPYTSTAIELVNTPLTYGDYIKTGSGLAAFVTNPTLIAKDKNAYYSKALSAQYNSGTLYMSALVKVTEEVLSSTNPSYILCFAKVTSSSTSEYARLAFMKGSSATKFKVGVFKSAAAKAVYYSSELTVGETYLFVLGYTWNVSASDDVASLWVNPTNFTTQPSANAIESSGSDAGYINGIYLAQKSTTNSICPTALIDGIRVATTWADLFTSSEEEEEEEEDKDPELTVSKSALEFKNFTAGETPSLTFTVTGANLTEDITISSESSAFSFSPASISKENAGTPTTVTVTLSATQAADFSNQTITIASGELNKTVTVKGNVYIPELVNVMAFSFLFSQEDTEGKIYNYAGTAAKILSVDSELKQIILKDATKSVKVQISDADWAANTYAAGMKVTKFVFTAEIMLGGQLAICTPITLTFAEPNFSREMTSTNLATICLKGDVSNFAKLQEQATFYKILCKQEYEGEVYNIILEEVNTNMEAGKPYIFQPKEPCTLKFYYSAATDFAGSENGLIGTFSNMDIDEGMFLVSNNMFCKAGTGCTLAANRAYIDMDQVPAEEDAQPKVGMRQLSLQNADKKMPTELAKPIVSSQAQKFIVKGKLMFKKNNNFYNAQGQIVK
ncbi:MAG: hypothetical protein MJZ65_02000 [Paludibacteraceae bacterium]|nr:hypothetical protein [Paludibacteraceae bacterium]